MAVMMFTANIKGERALFQFVPHVGRAKKRRPQVATVQRVVAAYYGIDRSEMKSASRTPDIVRPRQVAMYLARELSGCTLPQLGGLFGHKDHTTILHAIRSVEARVITCADTASDVQWLREWLTA
jgi:chromosomal replication initiator protein